MLLQAANGDREKDSDGFHFPPGAVPLQHLWSWPSQRSPRCRPKGP